MQIKTSASGLYDYDQIETWLKDNSFVEEGSMGNVFKYTNYQAVVTVESGGTDNNGEQVYSVTIEPEWFYWIEHQHVWSSTAIGNLLDKLVLIVEPLQARQSSVANIEDGM